jgi:hypothetical protein
VHLAPTQDTSFSIRVQWFFKLTRFM